MKRLRGFNAVRGFGTSGNVTPIDPPDTVPDAYSFTDVSGVEPSTQTTSNTVTVTGINTSTPVSVTGGQLSVNGSAWATSGTVNNDDTLELRVTSSAAFEGVVNVNVDIGGVLDTWTVTTRSDVTIQSLVESLPGYGTTLVGFWLPGHDPNPTVKDWSGFGNDGLRGNSTTPNTSSPNGATFDGDDFIQVPYAANMYTASTGDMTLGSVAAQNVGDIGYIVSQNIDKRAIAYTNSGDVFARFSKYRFAASQRVLNTSEHYMATGDGFSVNIYKNGILGNSTTGSTYGADVNSEPLYIGRNVLGDYFTGDIHCVYMYVNSAQDANAATINTTINDILALV